MIAGYITFQMALTRAVCFVPVWTLHKVLLYKFKLWGGGALVLVILK